MRSDRVKVLHPLLGKPMLSYPLDAALTALRPERTVVVVGYQGAEVQTAFSDPTITFVQQHEQLGTGHAVSATDPVLSTLDGTILILCGDIPLITAQTIRSMVNAHWKQGATLTVLTASLEDPSGYGRVVRSPAGEVQKVVEEKDATERERGIAEVNSGIYCVEAGFLFQALAEVRSDNVQGEYYLPDIVETAYNQKRPVWGYGASDPLEIMGINTRADLARAEEVLSARVKQHWMLEGVTIHNPASVYIESDVRIGKDTVIHPTCHLRGTTSIGDQCHIGPHVEIVDSAIGNRVTVRFCTVISEATIEDGATVGPFAHLRPLTHLEKDVRIGNFVEIKKSRVRQGTKANHLSYIGDAEVGERVNIGAGTITCNYDGQQKHQTIVEDDVFVGSNTALVAPIRIGHESVVGAGSTVTKDVPPHALVVTRGKQKHIPDWTKKRGTKTKKDPE